MKRTYSYIVEFRGGIYCSQVEAEDLIASLQSWLIKVKEQQAEIQYLGDKTIEEIAETITDEDYHPALLKGLKNIWHMHISTKQGAFSINIVQTEIS